MKAFVAVSFGTSVPEARKTIEKVENSIKNCFPDRDFFRAFTSRIICKKLQGRGEDICGVAEILNRLIEKGYDDVILQPTHIIKGYEYEKICEAVEAVKQRIPKIHLGEPLICGTDDLCRTVEITADAWLPDDGALVLMGHGSSHDNNMIYPAIQTAFSLKDPGKVFVGTVEGWPEITDVIEMLERTGEKNVTLAPFMLVAGDHAINDMAGDAPESWKNLLTEKGCRVSCIMEGIGEIPGIQQMYAEKARNIG